MKRLYLVPMFVLASISANALELPEPKVVVVDETVTISWTPANTRKNGDPLLPIEIKAHKIAYGTSAPEPLGIITVPFIPATGEGTQWTTDVLPPDVYYFSVLTVDKENLESDWSNQVEAEILESSAPASPLNVTAKTNININVSVMVR